MVPATSRRVRLPQTLVGVRSSGGGGEVELAVGGSGAEGGRLAGVEAQFDASVEGVHKDVGADRGVGSGSSRRWGACCAG